MSFALDFQEFPVAALEKKKHNLQGKQNTFILSSLLSILETICQKRKQFWLLVNSIKSEKHGNQV